MAAHRQIEGGFEWQLDLPPAAVRAVLSAVCVDLSERNGKRLALGHLLWGPKGWTVRFAGEHFELWPLGRNSGFYAMFGLPYGKFTPTKTGTRVTVHFACSLWKRTVARLLLGGGAASFMLLIALLMALSPPDAVAKFIWPLAPLGSLVFLVGFSVWVPEATKEDELRFLDEVFDARIVPGKRDIALAKQ